MWKDRIDAPPNSIFVDSSTKPTQDKLTAAGEQEFDRQSAGADMTADKEPCPGCDAQPSDYHRIGCDIEQCPYCGGQLISCACGKKPPLDDRMPWSGVWPGVAECREFNWYARLAPGKGWLPCRADEPGATEDLNRLHVEAVWDRSEKRFICRKDNR